MDLPGVEVNDIKVLCQSKHWSYAISLDNVECCLFTSHCVFRLLMFQHCVTGSDAMPTFHLFS